MAHNSKNPAVRRILRELAELRTQFDKDSLSTDGAFCFVEAVNDNLFELHFTVRGPPDTPYELGCYHGKLILPHDYPFKPPEITFLTPNGRFEVRKKICLSVSDYHPESWQPAWGIRTVLIGISSFMAAESAGSIGSVIWTSEERIILAEESMMWKCADCLKTNLEILPHTGLNVCRKAAGNNQELNFSYSKPTASGTTSPQVEALGQPDSTTSQQEIQAAIVESPRNNMVGNSSPVETADLQTATSTVDENIPVSDNVQSPFNAPGIAAARVAQMRVLEQERLEEQSARTLRSRIDFLIMLLLICLAIKLMV